MPNRLATQQTKWNANTALLQARRRATEIDLPDWLAHEALALLEAGEFDYAVGQYASALKFAVEVHEIIDNAEEA